MRRFWILLATEIKAWRHDPITAVGGFIPPLFMLLAFGLLFGGRLTFKIAVLNQDQGSYGVVLRETFDQVLSPFGTPYYDVLELPGAEAWDGLHDHRIDGIWVIPTDFSERLQAGRFPAIEMHFSNYNDDRAKNHRIYAAEILWRFYEETMGDLPPAPLALVEEYPREEMIEWFPVISVGVVLLGFMLGSMINVLLLTSKEQAARVTLEFGLAPRNLAWILVPKILLALLMGLITGTVLLVILYLWLGIWPGIRLWAVWLIATLVNLFWIPPTLLLGLRARYFAGAIATMLTGLTVFFIGGGLSLIRHNRASVLWIAWLFPNTHAVDPMRDLVLFGMWPVDWGPTLVTLVVFAVVSSALCLSLAGRRLRSMG
jgi:hypothetical protein